MDKDFMLNYFNKAVQPEWEELLKTPRYQPAASKRDAIEREFFRMVVLISRPISCAMKPSFFPCP